MQSRKLESFDSDIPSRQVWGTQGVDFGMWRHVISYIDSIFSYEYLYLYTKPYDVTSQ